MALREINLIPSEILYPMYLKRHISFWVLRLILSISVLGSIFFYESCFVLNKKRPVEDMRDVQALINTKTEDINRIQVELDSFEKQKRILETVKMTRPYSRVLFILSDIMNDDTWLTSLTIDSNSDKDEDDNDILELTGFAYSNDKLGNFLSMLSSEDLFKDVVLKFSKEAINVHAYTDNKVDTGYIQFQIECKM